MKVFVTGGAGYIGSHIVKMLGEAGHDILVYDNLSTGHDWAVLYGRLVVGDLADHAYLSHTIKDFAPDGAIHFAASIQVEESTREPLRYYRNNVGNSLNLLNALTDNGVKYLLYSSTAAVYGVPETTQVNESSPLNPINPYGASKKMIEQVLSDLTAAKEFKYVALRYFNVAGADPGGKIGQAYREATHLITRALKTAKGEYSQLAIFGTDYPTPDGTCIRDYIHVNDLAAAHILSFDYLMKTNRSEVMNCGYGHGFSVRQVVDVVKKVTNVDIRLIEEGRRAGDPPALIADSSKLRRLTGWSPVHDDLEFIVKTAWEWERKQ
jgi:UDP-glucose 4-epimerase